MFVETGFKQILIIKKNLKVILNQKTKKFNFMYIIPISILKCNSNKILYSICLICRALEKQNI